MILFLDDEVNVLKSIERLYRRKNIPIITTDCPFKALEILKNEPIEIIVSDFRMQKMNGLEFLKRASEIQPNAVKIILSGYAEESLIEQAIASNDIHEYLLKPFEQDYFVDRVQDVYNEVQKYECV